MQLSQREFLFFSIVATGAIFLGADLANQEKHPLMEDRFYFTDVLFVVIPAIVIILSISLAIRHGVTGNHSIAWILFVAATVSWFVGEQTYVYGNEYSSDDFSQYTSDFFYLLAYPIYFAFAIFYLRPIRRKISKRLVIVTSLVASTLAIPTFLFVWDKPVEDDIELLVNVGYPILDGLLLVPAFIGVTLFFRGAVNFLWTAITIGLIIQVIADTTYLLEEYKGVYYPGSMADLFYIWTYVLFAFGVYHHIRLYKIDKNAATKI